MSDQHRDETDSLVKMANQIAANFSFHPDAAERTADHIQRFWAPSMRQLLQKYIAAGNEGLEAAALEAARLLDQG